MKKFIVIHPYFFTLFPVLFLVSNNLDQASLSEILVPASFVLCITFLLLLLLGIFIKDSKKAAILISVSLILFFSYGHIYDLIVDLSIRNFEIGRHRYLLSIWGIIFSLSLFLTTRTRTNLQNLTNTLNVISEK